MKTGFNHDFYITSAGVIPLFYITIFLQDQLIENIAKAVNGVLLRNLRKFLSSISLGPFRIHLHEMIKSFLSVSIVAPSVYVVLAAPLAGIVAESLSLWALFYSSDNLTIREIVLWSMFGLLALISMKPVMSIYTKLFYVELDEDG